VDGSEILAMPVSESALTDFEVGFLPIAGVQQDPSGFPL
jgi:hypothetical protein